eukprot:scaffold20649_cov113-Isochrysis_galbana.AAC.3
MAGSARRIAVAQSTKPSSARFSCSCVCAHQATNSSSRSKSACRSRPSGAALPTIPAPRRVATPHRYSRPRSNSSAAASPSSTMKSVRHLRCAGTAGARSASGNPSKSKNRSPFDGHGRRLRPTPDDHGSVSKGGGFSGAARYSSCSAACRRRRDRPAGSMPGTAWSGVSLASSVTVATPVACSSVACRRERRATSRRSSRCSNNESARPRQAPAGALRDGGIGGPAEASYRD